MGGMGGARVTQESIDSTFIRLLTEDRIELLEAYKVYDLWPQTRPRKGVCVCVAVKPI